MNNKVDVDTSSQWMYSGTKSLEMESRSAEEEDRRLENYDHCKETNDLKTMETMRGKGVMERLELFEGEMRMQVLHLILRLKLRVWEQGREDALMDQFF